MKHLFVIALISMLTQPVYASIGDAEDVQEYKKYICTFYGVILFGKWCKSPIY